MWSFKLRATKYIFFSSNFRLLTEVPKHEELVNELSADNCTALYYAACVGNQEVAKVLLEKGGILFYVVSGNRRKKRIEEKSVARRKK